MTMPVPTVHSTTWPKLAVNANTHPAKKASLPVHSFGTAISVRDASYEDEDGFQKIGPGVATFKMDSDSKKLGKSLNGFEDSKLVSGTSSSPRPSSHARTTLHIPSARPPRGRVLPTLDDEQTLIDTRATRSYRDVASKCTPPPSPVLTPAALPALTVPAVLSPSSTTGWQGSGPQKPKLAKTHENAFPALTPAIGTGANKSVSSTSKSYANVTLAPSSIITSPAPISESPVRSPSRTPAKVVSLNISASTLSVSSRPQAKPRKKSSAPAPNQACLRLPERARSASVSSISSTPSFISTANTSLAGPRSWECEDWYALLVTFARGLSKKNRLAWEKILRCNPKDTSKMKWSEFDSALKAIGFESKTRGGSDLEYSPSRFGENAQPISYHRPHPGQEFSLGDLKAKACSFRTRYPGPVAALHEAWNLVDTRC